MGSANLNDVGILLGLLIKRCHQFFQSREQDILDLDSSSDVHGSGVGVVTALALIDVVIGVDRLLAAKLTSKELNRSVGYHLVGVHVGLSARTGLPDDQGEVVIVKLARNDLHGEANISLLYIFHGWSRKSYLVSCLTDSASNDRIKAKLNIDFSSSLLQNSKSFYHWQRHPFR